MMSLYCPVLGQGRTELVSVRAFELFYHVYLKHYVPLTHSLYTTLIAVNDERRVNVAITRAKTGLWIVGNADALKVDALWNKLIGHMQINGAFRQVGDNLS